MLVISESQVKKLLSYEICMEAIRECLRAVSSERAIQPMRDMIRLPNVQGIMGWMPGCIDQTGGSSTLGIKLLSVVPVADQRTAHNGVVVLFDEVQGHVMAVIEAGSITAIRTPAASAVATDLLALPDASSLSILGTGHQAEGHLAAIMKVRDLKEVKVWSPGINKAEAFASEAAERYGLSVIACKTAEAAVAGGDIICTATPAQDPILKYEWIAPGAHINAIGASVPMNAEIDNRTVAQTRFFVDHKATIEIQGGEYQRALKAGDITEQHIEAEIGEILLGKHPGRQSDDEITTYKSVGIVAYDLVAANAAYQAAKTTGIGLEADLLS